MTRRTRTLIGLGAAVAAWTIWPTPYRYLPGPRRPFLAVRINRFTGSSAFLTVGGWRTIHAPSVAGTGTPAPQADRSAPARAGGDTAGPPDPFADLGSVKPASAPQSADAPNALVAALGVVFLGVAFSWLLRRSKRGPSGTPPSAPQSVDHGADAAPVPPAPDRPSVGVREGLSALPGHTIAHVVETVGKHPTHRLFLVFADDTYFELYGDEQPRGTHRVYPGTFADVRQRAARDGRIVFEV